MKTKQLQLVLAAVLAVITATLFTSTVAASPPEPIYFEDGSSIITMTQEGTGQTVMFAACVAPEMGCDVKDNEFAALGYEGTVTHSFHWADVDYFTVCTLQDCVTLSYDHASDTINVHTEVCENGWCGYVVDIWYYPG